MNGENIKPSTYLNLSKLQQGLAFFKDESALLEWVNTLPLSELIDCLGDGHDGVWRIYELMSPPWQHHEVLDWFHLMENLYKLPDAQEHLQQLKNLLWHGKVDDGIRGLEENESPES